MDPSSFVDVMDRPQPSQRVACLSMHDSLPRACCSKRSHAESNGNHPPHKRWKPQSRLEHKHQIHRSAADSISSSFGSSVASGSSSMSDLSKRADDDVCPYKFIESVLVRKNDSNKPQKQMQPLHDSEFLHPTDEQIAAYSFEAIAAVRNSDLGALREIHSLGGCLSCCNRFGESLLHTACRNSSPALVRFLLEDANVSPRIRDDYGRTPLHDACWRGRPELEIVEMLLVKEPRLAFVSDLRGHGPFHYARREHWSMWKEFLRTRRELILS